MRVSTEVAQPKRRNPALIAGLVLAFLLLVATLVMVLSPGNWRLGNVVFACTFHDYRIVAGQNPPQGWSYYKGFASMIFWRTTGYYRTLPPLAEENVSIGAGPHLFTVWWSDISGAPSFQRLTHR